MKVSLRNTKANQLRIGGKLFRIVQHKDGDAGLVRVK
jgi:hypothetical protein